jgi:hypothetical protein
MAEKKPKKKKPRTPKYEDKTVVAGSFKDIMLAAGKDAKSKATPKKG